MQSNSCKLNLSLHGADTYSSISMINVIWSILRHKPTRLLILLCMLISLITHERYTCHLLMYSLIWILDYSVCTVGSTPLSPSWSSSISVQMTTVLLYYSKFMTNELGSWTRIFTSCHFHTDQINTAWNIPTDSLLNTGWIRASQ